MSESSQSRTVELGNFIVVEYDDIHGFLALIDPGSSARDANFFGGGYNVDVQIIAFRHQTWRKLDV
jgi:hypothetical protein